MEAGNGALKISPSSLAAARGAGGGAVSARVAERLAALDTNKDGQLDVAEVCAAVEQLSKAERERRYLKWALLIAAGVCLLTVAATAGLTYAVVALSQEVDTDGSGTLLVAGTNTPVAVASSDFAVGAGGALESKAGGGTVATAKATVTETMAGLAARLAAAPDADVAAAMSALNSVTLYDAASGERVAVLRVAEAAALEDGGLRVTSPAGTRVVWAADGSVAVGSAAGGGRRLLAASGKNSTGTSDSTGGGSNNNNNNNNTSISSGGGLSPPPVAPPPPPPPAPAPAPASCAAALTTWTATNAGTWDTSYWVPIAASNNGRFVALAQALDTGEATLAGNRAAWSDGGAAWTQLACVEGDWRGAAWGGPAGAQRFVAVSACVAPNPDGGTINRCGSLAAAMHSADGAAWTKAAAPDGGWQAAAHGGGAWVAVGDAGAARAMRSADNGATWAAVRGAVADAGDWISVAYDEDAQRFVAIGAGGASMTSGDGGATWAAGGALPAGGATWYRLAWGGPAGGRRFVAVASTAPSGAQRAAASADGGASWAAATGMGDASKNWGSVVWAPEAAAFVAAATGAVATSADGGAWAVSPAAGALSSAAWGGRRLAAVGGAKPPASSGQCGA